MQKLIIDVSEHQAKINWEAVKPHIDGAIIRCGYGDDDPSQDDKQWTRNISECERLGIPHGVYLYSYADTMEHARSELAHVRRLLKGRKLQYPVYFDTEQAGCEGLSRQASDYFCSEVEKMGYWAGVYTYASWYRNYLNGLTRYTLWIADFGINDGKPHTKPNVGATIDMWQYSSMALVSGIDGRVDISYCYKDFPALIGGGKAESSTSTATKTIKRGQVAADIHKRMVQDERFGYSWEERYGANPETWTVDGVTFKINVGDYDCSSSSITAWDKALTGTKYAGVLTKASTTRDMRRVFVNSGLFEWKPISFIAFPGDLYLNEENHVAICQQQVPDELSEFSWGDNGAYGNKRGDQSGFESRVNPFYDYEPDGWDGILHYNGKADTETPTPEPSPTPKPETALTWRVSTVSSGKSWLAEKSTGKVGKAIRWIAIKGVGEYRVFTRASGWLPWVDEYNVKDLENGCAGDGSVIEGVQVKSSKYRYAVRVASGWYPDMIGLVDTGGSSDNFAGDLANAIDGFLISKA